MIEELKTGVIPLCDRAHGPMVAAELVNELNDRFPAARCNEPLCNRVYTASNGYRDLDGENPARNRNYHDPRCTERGHYWMFVREELPTGELHYACPVEGCSRTAKVKPKGSGASED